MFRKFFLSFFLLTYIALNLNAQLTVNVNDVVIDEIMADPTPRVGLPNGEWLEVKNVSAFPINLNGWKLSDLTSKTGGMPDFMLQSDSFVIVCASSMFSSLSSFGRVISVSHFPSLNNDGDLISLISSVGKTIHAVQYNSSWYRDEAKSNGGWTLEMIDTKNPCAGINNWTASINAVGGTSGQKNSVDGINTDQTAPVLLHAFVTASTMITLVFDEPLDSIQAAAAGNYSMDHGISPVSLNSVSPLFNKVNIVLNSVTAGTIYAVTAKNIADCKGNLIGEKNMAKFGVAQDADGLDLVINEILYNPKPQGVDYVELYNRSKKIIDLSHVYIAKRTSSNAIGSIQQATAESILMFPGDFMVPSNPSAVKSQYITLNPDAFISVTKMPSFPDDKGDVIILNDQRKILDEVQYFDTWQFPLVSNTEGVALERINYNASSTKVISTLHLHLPVMEPLAIETHSMG